MEIIYTDQALKQLLKIKKGDKKNVKRIIEKIEDYAKHPQGQHNIKHLKGKYEDVLRLRTGDYRILFTLEDDKMIIAEIKQRQGTYND